MSERELSILRKRFNDLSSELDELKREPENNSDQISSLVKEKTVVYEEITRLTRKVWEDAHERVDVTRDY